MPRPECQGRGPGVLHPRGAPRGAPRALALCTAPSHHPSSTSSAATSPMVTLGRGTGKCRASIPRHPYLKQSLQGKRHSRQPEREVLAAGHPLPAPREAECHLLSSASPSPSLPGPDCTQAHPGLCCGAAAPPQPESQMPLVAPREHLLLVFREASARGAGSVLCVGLGLRPGPGERAQGPAQHSRAGLQAALRVGGLGAHAGDSGVPSWAHRPWLEVGKVGKPGENRGLQDRGAALPRASVSTPHPQHRGPGLWWSLEV